MRPLLLIILIGALLIAFGAYIDAHADYGVKFNPHAATKNIVKVEKEGNERR